MSCTRPNSAQVWRGCLVGHVVRFPGIKFLRFIWIHVAHESNIRECVFYLLASLDDDDVAGTCRLMMSRTKFIVCADFTVTSFTDVISSLNFGIFNAARIVKLI